MPARSRPSGPLRPASLDVHILGARRRAAIRRLPHRDAPGYLKDSAGIEQVPYADHGLTGPQSRPDGSTGGSAPETRRALPVADWGDRPGSSCAEASRMTDNRSAEDGAAVARRRTVNDLLDDARARLERLEPADAHRADARRRGHPGRHAMRGAAAGDRRRPRFDPRARGRSCTGASIRRRGTTIRASPIRRPGSSCSAPMATARAWPRPPCAISASIGRPTSSAGSRRGPRPGSRWSPRPTS